MHNNYGTIDMHMYTTKKGFFHANFLCFPEWIIDQLARPLQLD
jgi:hypothetical protein